MSRRAPALGRAGLQTGFTVALVGPDGAGKTTIARALECELGLAARYLYLGDNPAARTRMLPTTRLIGALKRRRGTLPAGGPPDRARDTEGSGGRRPPLASLRAALRVTNQLAEEWYGQLIAWSHVRRGVIVVFDRHFFFDYRAHDVAGGPGSRLSSRVHGFVLSRFYPRPDLVIGLDAAPDVLYARKGEGTLESIAARRLEYLDAADAVEHFVSVDAGRPLAEVKGDVLRVVREFARGRGVGTPRLPSSA